MMTVTVNHEVWTSQEMLNRSTDIQGKRWKNTQNENLNFKNITNVYLIGKQTVKSFAILKYYLIKLEERWSGSNAP